MLIEGLQHTAEMIMVEATGRHRFRNNRQCYIVSNSQKSSTRTDLDTATLKGKVVRIFRRRVFHCKLRAMSGTQSFSLESYDYDGNL